MLSNTISIYHLSNSVIINTIIIYQINVNVIQNFKHAFLSEFTIHCVLGTDIICLMLKEQDTTILDMNRKILLTKIGWQSTLN